MTDIREIQKIFVGRFKDLISELEIKSIRELSKRIDIPNRTLNNWLAYKRTPQIDSVVKIANFFNVSTDYMLGVKDDF